MTTIDGRLARQIGRVREHILSTFGRELELPVRTEAIYNSVFWPGPYGETVFSGTLFTHIGFTPKPGSTVQQVIDQLQEFEDTATRTSG